MWTAAAGTSRLQWPSLESTGKLSFSEMQKAEDRGGQMAAHPGHPEGEEGRSVRTNSLLSFFVLIEM